MENRKRREPVRHHALEHRQEILRTALYQISDFLTTKYILRRVKPVDAEDIIGHRGLTDFLSGKTKNLNDVHYEQLANAWVHSPLGRALRFPDPAFRLKADELLYALSTGKLICPKSLNFVGRYYMYYGSYVKSNCYGVRVIEVAADDDHIFTVTDSIRDTLRDDGRTRVSNGTLAVFNKCPQILLLPTEYNETKEGITLMAGNAPFTGDHGRVERITGTFLTKTQKGQMAFRHWLMIYEAEQTSEEMIAESGPFTYRELCKKGRQKHRAAFDRLISSLSEVMPDPLMNLRVGRSDKPKKKRPLLHLRD